MSEKYNKNYLKNLIWSQRETPAEKVTNLYLKKKKVSYFMSMETEIRWNNKKVSEPWKQR